MPTIVDSPVNRMKLSKPAQNAPSLKTANPKSCHPQYIGPQAPVRSVPVDLPIAK
jgi:hypothetical protein